MFFRGSTGDSVRQNGGTEKKKHSPGRAYRRFFEGYTEISVPKENGKGEKILRIYTAEFYRRKLDDRQHILLKLFYAVMYLIALIGFVTAAVEPLESNAVWYVAFPQTCCIFFFGWLFLGLMKYFFAERNMTIYSYRTSTQNVKRAALGLVLSLLWLSLMNACYLALHIGYMPFEEGWCIVRFLIGAGSTALLYNAEKRVTYVKVENEKGKAICEEKARFLCM